MQQNNIEAGSMLTRRKLLTRVAQGAMLVSASPYLGHAQAFFPSTSLSQRTRDSFDFGWKFF
jgi:hypothetical protein